MPCRRKISYHGRMFRVSTTPFATSGMARVVQVFVLAALTLRANGAGAQAQQVDLQGTEYRLGFVYSAPVQIACLRTELRHDGDASGGAALAEPLRQSAGSFLEDTAPGRLENTTPVPATPRFACFQAERSNVGACQWQAIRDRTVATVVAFLRAAVDASAAARICERHGGDWRSGHDVAVARELVRARELDAIMAQLVRERTSAPAAIGTTGTIRPRNADAIDATPLDLGNLPLDGTHDAASPFEMTIAVSRSPLRVPEAELRRGNFASGITTQVTTAGSTRGFPARLYASSDTDSLLRYLPRIVRADQRGLGQRAIVRVRILRLTPGGGLDLELLGVSPSTPLADPFVQPVLR